VGAEAGAWGARSIEYCGLDTCAMYAIWKHLHEMGQWEDGETLAPLLKAA
jgi:hypothetical protein